MILRKPRRRCRECVHEADSLSEERSLVRQRIRTETDRTVTSSLPSWAAAAQVHRAQAAQVCSWAAAAQVQLRSMVQRDTLAAPEGLRVPGNRGLREHGSRHVASGPTWKMRLPPLRGSDPGSCCNSPPLSRYALPCPGACPTESAVLPVRGSRWSWRRAPR